MVEEKEQTRRSHLASRSDALLAAWLAQTLEVFPSTSREFLAREKDPFRNPAGHALRRGLAGLLEGLLSARDLPELVAELEPLVRLLAVQEIPPSRALSFLLHLKDLARQEALRLGETALAEARSLEIEVDQLMLAAFDLYLKCREEIRAIEVNAAKRSLYVQLTHPHRRCGG